MSSPWREPQQPPGNRRASYHPSALSAAIDRRSAFQPSMSAGARGVGGPQPSQSPPPNNLPSLQRIASATTSSASASENHENNGNGGTGTIRLRIAGMGHYFELDTDPTITLGDLKAEIERKTDLPAPYQRLVAKRKKMDDDTMVLGTTIMDGNTIVSMGIGLEDRTKILFLHSPLYENDKGGIDKLQTLMAEIEKINAGRRSRDMDNKTVQELIIQVMCKIDCVETNGSEALRKMRKLTIRKAEDVSKKSEADVRGVDP